MLSCIISYTPIITMSIILNSSKEVVKGYLKHLHYYIKKPCGIYALTKHSLDRCEDSFGHPSTSVLSIPFSLRKSFKSSISTSYLNLAVFDEMIKFRLTSIAGLGFFSWRYLKMIIISQTPSVKIDFIFFVSCLFRIRLTNFFNILLS